MTQHCTAHPTVLPPAWTPTGPPSSTINTELQWQFSPSESYLENRWRAEPMWQLAFLFACCCFNNPAERGLRVHSSFISGTPPLFLFFYQGPGMSRLMLGYCSPLPSPRWLLYRLVSGKVFTVTSRAGWGSLNTRVLYNFVPNCFSFVQTSLRTQAVSLPPVGEQRFYDWGEIWTR